jgi:hypothetical protein
MRGHIVHRHGVDAADVDTHLHGRRAAHQVDRAFPELFLVLLQPRASLLRRMLDRPVVAATLHDAIADVRPHTGQEQILQGRLGLHPPTHASDPVGV